MRRENEVEDPDASLAQIVAARREAEELNAELIATTELQQAAQRLVERFFLKCAINAGTPPTEVKRLAAIVLLSKGVRLLVEGSRSKDEAKAVLSRIAEQL